MLGVAAGGWHSLALADTGDIYSWGWNESGQLGLPCRKVSVNTKAKKQENESIVNLQLVPALLSVSEDDVFTQVSGGSRHSAALTGL